MQMAQDPLVAYSCIKAAACLLWPNLTSFDVERVGTQFPVAKNKILIVSGTNDPFTPLHGALATYQYIGADNANILVHDAFGHTARPNPNQCTDDAIKTYFSEGQQSKIILRFRQAPHERDHL
jgi:hypothetical protein